MNNILVVGLGYIGLPLALRLAEIGHNVYGYDCDLERLSAIRNGISPFPGEPMISEKLVETSMNLWSLESYHQDRLDVIIFCTPVDTEDCQQLLDAMKYYDLKNKLVIVESTLPPLGADKIKAALPESAEFAYCPERLSPGSMWYDICHQVKIVSGSALACTLYADVTYGNVILTDLRTAELIKLVENAYRYEKVNFANRLALRCQELTGANVWKVVDILNSKLELQIDLLCPGAGIGGYCLEKDYGLLGLEWFYGDDYEAGPSYLIACHLGDGDTVFLGEAYKANVSDTRNSPARVIVSQMLADGHLGQYQILDATVDIPACETLVIVQAHSIYKAIDWSSIQAKTVIDLCGFFQREIALPEAREWEYVCLGISDDS